MEKRWIIGSAVAAVLIIAAFLFFSKPSEAFAPLEGKSVTLHKSMSCGCCGIYGDYVEGKGLNVDTVAAENPQEIKDQYNIPQALRSCHTMIVDGYFVEGHVPLEAVVKLLREKPDIAGIAVQGMPMGSPGMPGAKQEPFIVYAVSKDGTYSEYMQI